MKSTAQEFIAVLFLSRDAEHKAHLNTESYADVDKDDTALNNIIDEIVDLYLSTFCKLRFK